MKVDEDSASTEKHLSLMEMAEGKAAGLESGDLKLSELY
jgi:hypothetical protein